MEFMKIPRGTKELKSKKGVLLGDAAVIAGMLIVLLAAAESLPVGFPLSLIAGLYVE